MPLQILAAFYIKNLLTKTEKYIMILKQKIKNRKEDANVYWQKRLFTMVRK